MRITATIIEKGQITIPRAIRKHFSGKVVEFIVQENRKVVLQDLAILKKSFDFYNLDFVKLIILLTNH